METEFKALIVTETESDYHQEIGQKKITDLPPNEVLIKVEYAGLNYKDALSAFGNKGITRNYPHTPGVDAAGTVVRDNSGTFKSGQKVICTSYDLGMNTPGGFGQYISVPSSWIVPLPNHMDLKESMVLGTAAYTAGLAIYKMEKCGQNPSMGPIAVTGASGGVGSMAVALLNKIGYKVLASTGNEENHKFLREIGADEVHPREFFDDKSGRVLLRSKWAGAIDNVGGNTLATLIKACDRNGSVASIGLVDSPELNTTVYPFILNGVNLLGIDSAETPMDIRAKIWHNLSTDWKIDKIDKICTEITFDELLLSLEKMLKGATKGRLVLNLWK